MKIVLSAFFWFYLAASLTVFWFAVVIPWLVMLPFDRRRRFSHWYATFWANHFVALSPFWTVTVTGRERIADDRAYVMVANHQSAADIIAMYSIKKHFKWVSKQSVFYTPFMGWMMWMADYVGIRRGDARSRAQMLDDCRRHLSAGSSVMIFPEGTRSRDGEMKEFRRGAFVVAAKAGHAVVPIVVDGTMEALPKRSWIFTHDGKLDVRIHVLEPIEPDEVEGDSDRLRKLCRQRMTDELTRMRAAAP